MHFKKAMVIVTEGKRWSLISWFIRIATGSWWTHAFIVVDEERFVESRFPRARIGNVAERLITLQGQNRRYKILDIHELTDEQRENIAQAALGFVGMIYDIWNALYFLVFHSWVEGGKRLICSTIIARAVQNGADRNIFSTFLAQPMQQGMEKKFDNLRDAYCTPEDIYLLSDYIEV